jgi:hypothetical protein
MGWFGPLAALAICWAFGLPRHDRVSAEVPWGEVAEVVRSGREHFRIRRAAEQGDLVLEARYSQKDRLEERLRPLVGERFRVDLTGQDTALRPAVLRPAPGDEDRGILELIVRRGGWPLASGLGCLGIAFALYVARHLSGIAELERAAMGLLILGIVLTSVGRRRNANLWSGHVPQDGDAPDPVPVKWRNRPGLPGPGPQHVHVVPDMLRVVALEWEPWDVCVGVAAVLVTVPLAIRVFWLPLAILGVLGSVGLPRKRRYVVELPWSAITHVRIQGPKFVVSSDLPAPADLVRVEAPYSAGARLAAALRERLGDRVEIEGA